MERKQPYKSEEDLERLLMGHSPKLQSILESARKRFWAGAVIRRDEFWKEVEAESAGKRAKPSRAKKGGRAGR